MIKNIVFDIGDVLIEYRWYELCTDMGLSKEEAKRVGKEIFLNPHWDILDLGTIDFEIVKEAYAKMYPQDEEAIRYFLDHGERLHTVREDVWEKIYLLKEKGYRIYLLSNYPEHLFQKHIEGTKLLEIVDGAVISSRIHHMKPHKEIYEYLLGTYRLTPSECIFFDDKEINTEAARSFGMEAVTIHSKAQLLGLIDELLENANTMEDFS